MYSAIILAPPVGSVQAYAAERALLIDRSRPGVPRAQSGIGDWRLREQLVFEEL